MGSAHDQPNALLATRPTSSTPGQVGAQQRLLGVGHRACRAELASRLALGVRQERHHHQRDGGEHDADRDGSASADADQGADDSIET